MEQVFKLIKRELIFVTSTLKMQLGIALLFIIIFPLASPSLGFMGIIVVPYFLIYGVMAYEEKSKTETIIATLPVSSTQVCISKYILGFFYIILGLMVSIGCIYLGQLLFKGDPLRILVLENSFSITASLCATGFIYISIILPILFKLGTEKARFLMMLLYGLVFATVPAVESILNVSTMSNILANLNPMILLFISLCIYGISIMSSISICSKREY